MLFLWVTFTVAKQKCLGAFHNTGASESLEGCFTVGDAWLHSAASSRHEDSVCVLFTSSCREETVTAKAFHYTSCVAGALPYKQRHGDQEGTQRLSHTDRSLCLMSQLFKKSMLYLFWGKKALETLEILRNLSHVRPGALISFHSSLMVTITVDTTSHAHLMTPAWRRTTGDLSVAVCKHLKWFYREMWLLSVTAGSWDTLGWQQRLNIWLS